MEDDYTPVKIPTELAKHIDEFIQDNPKFRTRAGFVRYVIAYYIDNDGYNNNHSNKTTTSPCGEETGNNKGEDGGNV